MKWYSVKKYKIPVNSGYLFVALSFDELCSYKLAKYSHNIKSDEFSWFDEYGSAFKQVTHFCIPEPVEIEE